MSTPPWKKQLEPLAQMYAAICETIEGLDDDDLTALIDATKRSTTTNCWWAIHQVAPIARQIAKSEWNRRQTAAAQDHP